VTEEKKGTGRPRGRPRKKQVRTIVMNKRASKTRRYDSRARNEEEELWFQGNLRHLTKEGPQRDLYDAIQESRPRGVAVPTPYVLNLHRRLGKTFLSLILVLEECLKRPKRIAKFLAPTGSQAKDILDEKWGELIVNCPDSLVPTPRRRESSFLFFNPRWMEEHEIPEGREELYFSKLIFYGVDKDRGGRIRGGSTDIAVVDEVREIKEPVQIVDHALIPTFKDREDPLLILVSTPPESMDHQFVSEYIKRAENAGTYFCIPASKDPTWDKETD